MKEVTSKGEMISSFEIKADIGRMVSWQGYLFLGYLSTIGLSCLCFFLPFSFFNLCLLTLHRTFADTNGVGVAVYTTTGEHVKEIPMSAVRYVYVVNDDYLVCCSASTDIMLFLIDRNWNVVAETEPLIGSIFGMCYLILIN